MATSYQTGFIQSLNPNEIRVIEEHLQKSTTVGNPSEENKDLKLFKALASNPDKTFLEEDLSSIMGSTDGALRVLKSRMFDKVLEALTHDNHILNIDQFNEFDSIIFSLKKKLLIFKIVYRSLNQRKVAMAFELLNEIIEVSKEYEVYEVCIEALTLKKYFRGIRLGVAEFEKFNKEIDYYETCHKAMYKATDNYYRLILNTNFIKSLTEKEQDNDIRSSIIQMENDYKETKSQQVNYYLHIMKQALYEREKNYVQAIECCKKVISITKKSKSLYRKERIGYALINLSQLKVYINKYKEALIDVKKSQTYFIENSFNHLISKEPEFYAHFYFGSYKKAFDCTEELLAQTLIDSGEFRKSKFVFYQSCILFATGKYKETLDVLNKSLEIEKDKSRWNISLRILNIITFVELDMIDQASNSLESLRKYMERTAKNDEIKARDILIVKLLREIEKKGFIVDTTDQELAKMIKDLSEKNKPTSWEHYSTELISFHEWLVTKRK
jgi:tetratricopeptide (TPR) repeat protein